MTSQATESQNNLQRFVEAQQPVYDQVRSELRKGWKASHWMWFIFPQIAGLGRSPTAVFYAISSLSEAKAFMSHPILGVRLNECTTLAINVEGRTARQIFGFPDDMKLRSCMTLFALATVQNDLFVAALDKYFEGIYDPATLEKVSP